MPLDRLSSAPRTSSFSLPCCRVWPLAPSIPVLSSNLRDTSPAIRRARSQLSKLRLQMSTYVAPCPSISYLSNPLFPAPQQDRHIHRFVYQPSYDVVYASDLRIVQTTQTLRVPFHQRRSHTTTLCMASVLRCRPSTSLVLRSTHAS